MSRVEWLLVHLLVIKIVSTNGCCNNAVNIRCFTSPVTLFSTFFGQNDSRFARECPDARVRANAKVSTNTVS